MRHTTDPHRYPRPGALAAAQLLGTLATGTDDALADLLATTPAETWARLLPETAVPVGYGTLLRLTGTLGAAVLTGGAAYLQVGGVFDRACELASVDPTALEPPHVGWVLQGPHLVKPLGFPAGADGAVAALGAAAVLLRRLADTRQPLTTDLSLQGPDGHPLDLGAAQAASAQLPAAWVAAAALHGTVAALDTWVPATGDPRSILGALHAGHDITEQAGGWRVNGHLYSIVSTVVLATGTETRWIERPAPAVDP